VAVHVSIHDVSPVWRDEVEAALEMCNAVQACPALLVVPDFHGRAPLLESVQFCERLRQLQARGHEVYLHGFFHKARERYSSDSGGRLRWLFTQRMVSAGEAEMSDVTPSEGRKRIEEGERVLRDAGLRLDGFVPPAWSLPQWLFATLAARGYGFTEDHLRVYDPAGRRARASLVLNWASRSPARLAASVAWCRAARHARALVPARVAIHPRDMRVPSLRREIARTLAWARGDIVARGRDLISV
jgi:uncharacterized protein